MVIDDDARGVKGTGMKICDSKNYCWIMYKKNLLRELGDTAVGDPCNIVYGNFLYGLQQTWCFVCIRWTLNKIEHEIWQRTKMNILEDKR